MSKTALMAAGIALSAAGSFMQYQQANAAAEMQQQAAAAEYEQAQETAWTNLKNQEEEFTRQQELVDRKAKDEKSDLTRRLNAELGALRVAIGEGGAAGSNNAIAMFNDQSYLGGVELSRVEANRKENLEAIDADKRVAGQQFVNVNNTASLNYAISSAEARMRASAARTNAFIGTLSSGVRIVSQGYGQRQQINQAKD